MPLTDLCMKVCNAAGAAHGEWQLSGISFAFQHDAGRSGLNGAIGKPLASLLLMQYAACHFCLFVPNGVWNDGVKL